MLRRTAFLSLAAACLIPMGCSNGGTIVLELTDAPPDTANIDHVYVSLRAIEVHVVDKGSKKDGDPKDSSVDKSDKWRTLAPPTGRFDLIALQNDVSAGLGELELPEGKITQIRLFVDEGGENVSPPAREGPSFNGITGTQGPAR